MTGHGPNHQLEDDFPETSTKTGQKQTGKPFKNELFNSDSLTRASAYINSIRNRIDGERQLTFVSLGLIVGREMQGEDFVPIYQNVDVLAGRTLSKSFALLEGEYEKGSKLFGTAEIRNLSFKINNTDSGIYLDSRGILETFTFGFLDR